jgi:cyclic pyranopterin phosphate synthase
MPRDVFGPGAQFLPRADLLTFEEIERLARIFVSCGVRKLRITGGEPLVRHDLERLVALLADIDGIEDIAMTTNGALLSRKAKLLAHAGLRRVTVSLDSLDDEVFRAINDVAVPVTRVLEGIEAAVAAGLGHAKINMVVKRGANDDHILAMAEYFRHTGHTLRFIEYMDVGSTNGWQLEDVVAAADIVQAINAQWPLEQLAPNYPGEVANRYRYLDGAGEIGAIASVTQPFCRGCTRARLSPEGRLYTCLFGAHGHDLRSLLRGGANDSEITDRIRSIWTMRTDRYSEVRTAHTSGRAKVEMSRIGG